MLTSKYWVNNMCDASYSLWQLNTPQIRRDLVIEVGPHPAFKGPSTVALDSLQVNAPHTGLLARGKNGVEQVSIALGFIWRHLGSGSFCLSKPLSGIRGRETVSKVCPCIRLSSPQLLDQQPTGKSFQAPVLQTHA